MQKTIAIAVTLAEPGGVQSFIVKFCQWLLKKGYAPIVLAGDGTWLKTRCEELGVRFIHLKKMGREIHPLRDPFAVLELRNILKELKPDVIHLNSTKMGVVGSFAAKLAGVPRIVYRIGGWVFLEDLPLLKKKLYTWIERWSGSLKDQIICVHPKDCDSAKTVGIKPKQGFIAIPNGIELNTFEEALLPKNQARQKLAEHCKTSFTENQLLIGTIAHLYPPKDLPRYMEACHLVAKANPEARFIILGEGMQRTVIEAERKKYGLENTVFLPGSYEQAQTLLAGLDLFVLPSSKEGMAWSVLEAMAAKTPCVVTGVGANRWMLNGHGWIVPPKDPQSLSSAIIEALNHPDVRASHAANAYERVKQEFPLERTMQAQFDALHLS